jgi:hypothetical protein
MDRKSFQRSEIAWMRAARSLFAAKICSGFGTSSAKFGTKGLSVSSWLILESGAFARLSRRSISASLMAMRVTKVENLKSLRNLARFVKAR